MTKGQTETGILNVYRCKRLEINTSAQSTAEAKELLDCKICAEAGLKKGKCYGPKMLDDEPVKKQAVKQDITAPDITALVDESLKVNVPGPEAIKHDAGKARFDLVPPNPLMELVQVYTVGAVEYGDRNWEKGLSWGRVFAAIMRHIWAWRGGEDKDPKDGLSHLSHAAWGCMTLMEYARTHPELDDR